MTSDVLVTNPFTDEYVHQELEFIGPLKYRNRKDTIRIVRKSMVGIDNEYLNKQFFLGQFEIPILFKKNEEGYWKIWMSITPMEVQSLFVPIRLAYGVVGTSGLGLGYFPLRVAAKEEVDRVDVYEIDPDIIKMFKYKHRGRPELKKINVIEGDVYANLKDKTYDFFLADHYRTLLSDDVITDYLLFWRRNNIDVYRFWGEEKLLFWIIYGAAEIGQRRGFDFTDFTEKEFFRDFIRDEEKLGLCTVKELNYGDLVEDYLAICKEVGIRGC